MQSANECFNKVKKNYLNFLIKEKIYNQSPSKQMESLRNVYIPISFWIVEKYKKKNKTLFLGLSGGQGSGKTTITNIIKIILKKYFKKNVCVISIDDFYKTLKDRTIMANKKHPLFKTRGVPGTHNINLIKEFFISLSKKKFKRTELPKFNKSIDDREKKLFWRRVKKKPEIVILEGWCVGAKPQLNSLLSKPINDLEKHEDKDLIWRKYVNDRLKNEYKKIFSMIDDFIFMKVPNIKLVFKWRYLQEKKLRKKYSNKKKVMTFTEIKRFIMFYERITLQMIEDLSKSASVLILFKKNHGVKKVLFKK